MAKNVFNDKIKYRCVLYGHGFTRFPTKEEPTLIGTLAKDTIETNDPVFGKKEYAVFTVDEPKNGEYPSSWVGTYRLSMLAKNSWFGGEVKE